MSWLAKDICMKRYIFLTGLLMILLGSCKKEDNETPGTGNIVYKKIDSVLAYQRHAILNIDNDSIADIILGSELIIHNNTPHLYLYAATDARNFNKLLVKQENIEAISGYWAYPRAANQIIESNTGEGYRWIRKPDKAILADITSTGNTPVFNGVWKNLEKHYLGIQLVINNQNHFGWICISHEIGTQVLTIHDLAYNTVADQPIKAGERTL